MKTRAGWGTEEATTAEGVKRKAAEFIEAGSVGP